MKLLIVCQYYYPENFQVTPIAEYFASQGDEVTVLTGLPNYPTGIVPEEYCKGHRDETINGVRVIRCYERGRKKGALSLALNYMSFLFSASRRARKIKDRFDLVLCYQLSPVMMAIPAKIIAKAQNIPFLIYCCDIWPESLKIYIHSEKNPLYRLIYRISTAVYSAADKIICQSVSFIDYFSRVHSIPERKLAYIPAFADEAYLNEDFHSDNNGMTDFVFLGNLGHAQDLNSVLMAVKRLSDRSDFCMHFVGDGACLDEMKKFTEENRLQRIVRFYGRQPVERMPEYYRLADACILSLKADSEVGFTLPTKVQGYMAAGKPILGMIDGSAQKVIAEAEAGACVNAGDVDAFAALVLDFIENRDKYKRCGENARRYFQDHFTKEIFFTRLQSEIERMLAVRTECEK